MTKFTGGALPRDAGIYVAGHSGLAGSAISRYLRGRGFTNLIGRRSAELDLRDREAVFDFFAQTQPSYVIDAAAKVGGILANDSYPAEFLSDNLRIQVNVLDAAHRFGVKRLLFLGTSCSYPKHAAQPITEEALLTGPLERTNEAYAIAKIAGIAHVRALRKQHGCSYISAMPANLYGPGDNFDPVTAHVLPALLRRMHEAKLARSHAFTVWGTGTPRREFLHADDLAAACLTLLEGYDAPQPVNVGTGIDISIRELAALIAQVVGYQGEIVFDPSKPDGTPRKLLDVSRLQRLGWSAQIRLREGLASTYEWWLRNASTKNAGSSTHGK